MRLLITGFTPVSGVYSISQMLCCHVVYGSTMSSIHSRIILASYFNHEAWEEKYHPTKLIHPNWLINCCEFVPVYGLSWVTGQIGRYLGDNLNGMSQRQSDSKPSLEDESWCISR
jgi:hypothetical protein